MSALDSYRARIGQMEWFMDDAITKQEAAREAGDLEAVAYWEGNHRDLRDAVALMRATLDSAEKGEALVARARGLDASRG